MDQGLGTPEPIAPEAAPKKTNTALIIIIVVVAVLLCCCCLVVVLGYFLGDQILEALDLASQLKSSLNFLM